MRTIQVDLETLSEPDLDEARHAFCRECDAIKSAHPTGHDELIHLFELLEETAAEEWAARHADGERHTIAQALGIDEETGEWEAGA